MDVRIIASTNQNLREKIKNSEFREDFFYRINVLPIQLPALRDRRDDIPLIANHLLEKHCLELNKPGKTISPELMEVFLKHHWEGNIREFENTIVQGILFSTTDIITPKDVKLKYQNRAPETTSVLVSEGLPYRKAKEQTLLTFNTRYIGTLLTRSKGNVSQAARACGLERQALQQIMRRYNIRADQYRQTD